MSSHVIDKFVHTSEIRWSDASTGLWTAKSNQGYGLPRLRPGFVSRPEHFNRRWPSGCGCGIWTWMSWVRIPPPLVNFSTWQPLLAAAPLVRNDVHCYFVYKKKQKIGIMQCQCPMSRCKLARVIQWLKRPTRNRSSEVRVSVMLLVILNKDGTSVQEIHDFYLSLLLTLHKESPWTSNRSRFQKFISRLSAHFYLSVNYLQKMTALWYKDA